MDTVQAIRENLREQFGGTRYEGQIESLVEFEASGLERAPRARTSWCECADTTDQESYYRREGGRHGFFHDPQLGGCGGITQTG